MLDSLTDLDPEQQQLRAMVAELTSKFYAPHAREWDRARTPLPLEERKRLAGLGLLVVRRGFALGGHGAH